MVKVYQRAGGQVTEPPEYRSDFLAKLYGSGWVRWLLPFLTRPAVSLLLTLPDYSPFSREKIARFIKEFDLQLDDYVEQDYRNFADFFSRKIKADRRPLCGNREVMAVADAKLQVFEIEPDLTLSIKGQIYSLGELLADESLARTFSGGWALVYRLGLEDLHRYLAAESGPIVRKRRIKGQLHSVREVAQKKRLIYRENRQAYTLRESDLGPVLQMEVGALLVGRIYNHEQSVLIRGQEKGYFGLGGSTIIVLYPAHTIELDRDLLEYSAVGIETQVQMGERIGKRCLND